MKLGITGAVVLSLGGACASTYTTQNVVPHVEATCEEACTNLEKLGCGRPRCVRFCREIEETAYLDLPLGCVSRAMTKTDATRCGVPCE